MASKYCPNCGYANDAQRGACLMCHTPLPAVTGAVEQVPEPVAGMQPPLAQEAMAALIVGAPGESFGGVGGAAAETDYGPEPAEDYGMEALEAFEAVDAGEETAPAEADLPVEEPAEAPAEPPAEELEEVEEEFVPPAPPPGAIELEEEPVASEPDLEADVEEAAPEYEEEIGEQEVEEVPPAPPVPEDVVEPEPEEAPEEPSGDEWTIGRE